MAEDHGHDEHGGGEGGEDHGKGHKSHGSHGPGHGGGHEEHAGAPEWLISFADNVALLMGFFVILLAMNMGPKAKPQGNNSGQGPGGYAQEFTEAEMRWIELQYGMNDGFNNRATLTHKDPKMRKLAQDYAKVQEQRKRNKDTPGESPTKTGDPNQTTVVPNLTVEFDPSRATLSAKSRDDIAKLVERELRGKGWVIEVRGHVSAVEAAAANREQIASGKQPEDDGPDGVSPLFPTSPTVGSGAGYQLSYQRAFAVADELARNGIPWRNLRLVACSDMDRKVPRTDSDPMGHGRNQRVQIIQTKDPLPPDPMAMEPGQGYN